MTKFYFTWIPEHTGEGKGRHGYQGSFTPGGKATIVAKTVQEAVKKFQKRYPNFRDGEGDYAAFVRLSQNINDEPVWEICKHDSKRACAHRTFPEDDTSTYEDPSLG